MITAQICKDSSGQFVNLPSSHPSEDLSSASQTSGKGRGKKWIEREHWNAHSSWIPIKSQKSIRLTFLFDFSLHSHFFEMDMYVIYLSPNTRPLNHLVHGAGTKRRWTSVRFNIFATCRLGKVAVIHHVSAFWQVLYTDIPNHFAGYEFVSALMFRKSWKFLKIFQCWKRRMQTLGH